MDKPGIYMEELMAEFRDRGLEMPDIYGLMMDDREKTNETILSEFDDYIRTKLASI